MTTQNKKKTHYVIILDRSGSMGGSAAAAAVEGYNEFVDQWKVDAQDPELDIDVSLVTFNGQVFEHLWCQPADKLEKASIESFQPAGSTALYDAIGYVVDKFNAAEDANDKNVAYYVTIITDGQENASKHYGTNNNISIIKELLEGCEHTNRWTFNFLGSSKNEMLRLHQAVGGAIPLHNMAVWSNNSAGTKKMMHRNRASSTEYLKARKAGATKLDKLYDCEVADLTEKEEPILASIDFTAPVTTTTTSSWSGHNYRSRSVSQQDLRGSASVTSNTGTANVFSTSNCVIDSNYSRPTKK